MDIISGIREAPISRRPEPLVGWRLWRVRETALHSWAARHQWNPGDNAATCLAPEGCAHPPGRRCMCGFWAVLSPLRALELARAERHEHTTVLGMVRGWGEVAIHSGEGFRAEHASIACLFTDWAWDAAALPWWAGGAIERLCWRMRKPFESLRRHPRRDSQIEKVLPEVARRYGVPLLAIDDAVRLGALAELGAAPCMVDEARRWSRAIADQTAALESHHAHA